MKQSHGRKRCASSVDKQDIVRDHFLARVNEGPVTMEDAPEDEALEEEAPEDQTPEDKGLEGKALED